GLASSTDQIVATNCVKYNHFAHSVARHYNPAHHVLHRRVVTKNLVSQQGRYTMLPDERRDVLEHIRMSYNNMSKSQKRVAEFLLTSGIDVVYLSASRIADLVDVNRSTVVRTAQALGYEGFVDLQADLQQQLLKRFSTADRVKMDLLRLNEDIEAQDSSAQGMAILSAMVRAE